MMMIWMERCRQAGILTDANTGIPISKMGSIEFIETFVKKVSSRDGFTDILAQGTFRAANTLGDKAKELAMGFISKPPGQNIAFDPRLYISSGLIYAMEPRQSIWQLNELYVPVCHWYGWFKEWQNCYLTTEVLREIARVFWGGELAVDFSTYEGKALAARMAQDRGYAKECLVLCTVKWPITHVPHSEDHLGDPTLESKVLSSITGRDIDEQGFYKLGERIFNLQRAIRAREGHMGRESDKLLNFYHDEPLPCGEIYNEDAVLPGKDGNPVSRIGEVFHRDKFEDMKSELYQLRGWDVTSGLQTRGKLLELGLEDVAEDLHLKGLLRENS
jgi:aldehyde:ferredoxin oxidoreductase